MRNTAGAAPLPDPMSAKMVLGTYSRFHLRAMLYSLGQLLQNPLATGLTVLAMGITLALPVALDVVVKQISQWSTGIENSTQMTLFLDATTTEVQAKQLLQQLRRWPELQSAAYISREQALEEFRETTGVDEVVDILAENPLPAQIRVIPKLRLSQRGASDALIRKLQALPGVSIADLDLHWLQRLDSLSDLSWRLLWLLSLLFGLGVAIIAANSIRQAIENQRDSIEVSMLVGATRSYVRRPFLYTGLWFGLSSGVIAWICVNLSLLYLQQPAGRLASLFNQELSLFSYGLSSAKVIPIACLLGLLGARAGVGRYIRHLEPV